MKIDGNQEVGMAICEAIGIDPLRVTHLMLEIDPCDSGPAVVHIAFLTDGLGNVDWAELLADAEIKPMKEQQ